MTDNIAIKVKNVTKVYHLYDKSQDRFKEALHPFRKSYHHDFFATNDISFEIKKGETVGIIGENGAGKSTLLKMITGVLTPTSGEIYVNGKIASLLELGAGFNPEMTGLENIYLNGTLMGFSQQEIEPKIEGILEFADIGEFIDQPVKTYSSGMMVRLAFAVAINVDPEILIIDEALSVGDELFQRKCFSRIEAIKDNGTTILFVSHSAASIVELCDRAILIDAGENLAIGLPKQVIGHYQKLIYAPSEKRADIRSHIRQVDTEGQTLEMSDENSKEHHKPTTHVKEKKETFDPSLKPSSTIEYESHGAYIDSPSVFTLSGEQVNNLVRGKDYRYMYTIQFTKSASNVRFGMLIKTTSGVELGGAVSANSSQESLAYVEAGSSYRVEFRFHCALNSGVYFLNSGVLGNVDGSETYLHRLIDIAMFRVQPDTKNLATGIVDFGCYPEIERIEA